ncbi:hypothetical protein ECTPHS_13652, partial [Ectothiorhodospira sp. PHS-1]|uniref:glycosyltransferase family 2 protein n=1 Tax=Ectothiorhodospira sp. PHS-1 TaxID=519989 RepID=UPI00024A8AB8
YYMGDPGVAVNDLAAAFADSLRLAHGVVRPGRPTVYSIVRDEMFFLPAFLNYYRSLGVRQFLFFDDQSRDGTFEFLAEQPDCCILVSDKLYGDDVELPADPVSGKVRRRRFGVLLKSIIPHHFLGDGFAIYADADEFLLLPERFTDVSDFFRVLDEADIRVVSASLLEMYPATLEDMRRGIHPASLQDLVESYPYFDDRCLLTLRPAAQPALEYKGASWRLFRQHGVCKRHWINRHVPAAMIRVLGFPTPSTACVKTPILRWGAGVYLDGSHRASQAPSEEILLTMLHFKFTADLQRKMDFALTSRAYAGGSRIYRYYDCLFRRLGSGGGAF